MANQLIFQIRDTSAPELAFNARIATLIVADCPVTSAHFVRSYRMRGLGSALFVWP